MDLPIANHSKILYIYPFCKLALISKKNAGGQIQQLYYYSFVR